MGKLSNQGRSGGEAAKDTEQTSKTKQRKKNMVQCSTLVVFFQVLLFGILFYISSHRKDQYPPENSNLNMRTSLRTTLIEVDVMV